MLVCYCGERPWWKGFCWHGQQFPSVVPSLASLNSLLGPVRAQAEPVLGCTHSCGHLHVVPTPTLPVGRLPTGRWEKGSQTTRAWSQCLVPGRPPGGATHFSCLIRTFHPFQGWEAGGSGEKSDLGSPSARSHLCMCSCACVLQVHPLPLSPHQNNS